MAEERDFKKWIGVGSLALFFLLILGFGFYGAQGIIFGVKITKVNLTNGAVVTDKVINVTGNAKNAVNIYLNGREISIDQKGNFKETIALLTGYNIVEITARDKFGYTDKKDYQLIGS